MARRASSSHNPLWILLAVIVGIAVIGGGYTIVGRANDPYRTMTPLPVRDYLENANSLRGNVYRLEGTVSKALEYSPTAGRLFAVDVDSTANGDVVPLLIPSRFNNENIERGQRYQFKIEVGERGVLQVQDVKKT
jgi:hypothetical protein